MRTGLLLRPVALACALTALSALPAPPAAHAASLATSATAPSGATFPLTGRARNGAGAWQLGLVDSGGGVLATATPGALGTNWMTFRLTWTASSGALAFAVDRDRSGAYASSEQASTTVSSLAGQSFQYLRLYLTADASSQVEADTLVVNGNDAGSGWSVASGSQTVYVDAGSTASWTVTGRVRFVKVGSAAESPKLELSLGGGDTSPPSTPTGLAAATPTSGKPALSWTASSDLSGIASYRISRGGALVATVTSTSWTDVTLAEGSYAYSVVAVDGAGNQSAAATTTVVVDRTPPAVATGLTGTPGPGTAVLDWADASGAASYVIRRDGADIGTSTTSSFTDATTPTEGSHAYAVVAVDAAGNAAAASSSVNVVIDRTPPAVPTGVNAGPTPTRSPAVITFTAVSGAASYRIYRGTTLAGQTTATTFTDSASIPDGTYAYTVTALDTPGNESAKSTASTIVLDTTAPSRPGRPTATRTITNELPQIRWTAVTGAVQYGVWRGSRRIALVTGTSFTEPTAPAEGSYAYKVSALDQAGNESSRSRGRTVTYDVTAPPAPALTISASPSAARPVLSWSSVRDKRTNAYVAGYKVYRNGTFVKPSSSSTYTTSYKTRTYTDSGAVDGTIEYAVAAIDSAGNESTLSVPRSYVYDTVAPPKPILVTARTPTNVAPQVSWPAVAGAASYVVRRGGTSLGRTTTTSFTDSATTLAEGSYAYDVAASDAAGNTSAYSDAVTVVVDRTPPGAVTGLAAPALTRVAPHLTFTAVTGAASVNVYRDGTAVGSTTTTAFDDVTLTDEGSHAYAVAAVDAAGNEGARSAAVTTVYDVTPPAVPAGLTATSPTRSHPALGWQAVTGAASYVVRRNGTQVGTPSGTSFSDTTVPGDGAYSYTVAAVDAAGNASAGQAEPLAVTYDATPPAAPTGVDGTSPTNAVPVLGWLPVSGAVSYRVLRDDAQTGTTGATSFSDSALVPVLESAPPGLYSYAYRVVAIDAAGNASAPSDARTIAVDLRSTEDPTLLDAPSPTRTAPYLRWTRLAAADRYRVLRDGAAVGTTTASTFDDTSLAADGAYAYAIVALRADGSELGRSTPRTVVRDTGAPLAPTGVTAPAATNRPPAIGWSAVSDAVTYRVYRGSSLAGSTAATTLTDTGTGADGSYTYTVTAVDAAGNESAPSSARTVVLRTTPPAAPTGLAAVSPTRLAPSLTWTAVAGADHYVVYRGNAIAGTPTAAALQDALPADGTYGYRVAAVDAAGNESAPSATVAVVVDTVAPAAPGTPTAPALTNAAPVVSWTRVAGASAYAVRRGGTVVGRVGDVTSYTDAFAAADGTLTYDVVAVDAAGNESVPSPSVQVVLDRTPPGVPAGLVAPTPTATAPYLTWTAVSGAVRYRVLRAGTEIDSVTTAAFQDAGVTTDGTYAYTVVAVDAAGNESAPSAVARVVVDTVAPDQVKGLTGTTPTNGFPALSWTATATAVRYIVYRDDEQVAEVASPAFSDTTIPDDGTFAYTVSAVDGAGNEGAVSAAKSITVDTTVAGVPSDLDADSPTNTAPELSWTGVPGSSVVYTVRRDGTAVGTSGTESFTDTTLKTDGTYAYTVTASVDGSASSAPSSPVTVVYDATPPAAPTGVAATSPTAAAPAVSWSAVTGAVAYDLRRDGVVVESGAATSLTDDDLATDGSYVYTVVARDAAGNASAPSAAVTVVHDTTPPAAPAAPTATSPTRQKPSLTWTAVAGATGYQVYRGGTLATTTSATTFQDTAIPAEGTYLYRLVAVDAAGNASGYSPAAAVAYDVTAPAAPTGLTAPSLTNVSPVLAWTAVVDATAYGVWRDGTKVATATAASFTDTGLATDGSHAYAVSAIDAAGNESAPSSPAASVVRDTVAPARPVGLAGPTPTHVAPQLTWTAVADAARYRVTVDGVQTLETTTASATLAGVPADGEHLLRVIAVDAAGNASTASAPYAVVVDTQAPAAPAGLAGTSPTRSGPAISWQAVADAVRYRVRRDGAVVGEVTTTAFTDALASDRAVAYTVTAVDAAGNESAPAGPLQVQFDVTAPAAPGAVRATSPSRSPVHLAWDAATDAAQYRVYRNGVALALATGTAYDDAALTGDGTHTYAVAAIDAAGNESAPGPAATVVVDVTPPAAPTGLAGTSPTAQQPALSWTAAAGATTYRVLRNGTQVGTTSATAFEDALAADATVSYTVIAVDAAGNASPASAARSITYDTTPPPAPIGLTGTTPTETSPVVTWTAAAGAVAYRVTRDGATVGTVAGTTFTDAAVAASGTYVYAVVALDAAGNVSPPAAAIKIEVRFSPFGVTGLTATSPATSAVLSWTAGSATGWVIWRDGAALASVSTPTYTDTAAGEGSHRYAVGVAGSGDLEPPSTVTVVVDRTAPAAVTGLHGTSPTNQAPSLTWTAVADAVRYAVAVDGAEHLTTAAAYASEALPDGSHAFAVRAIDAAGNRSAAAETTIEVDTTAPDAPVAEAAASPTAGDPVIRFTAPGAARASVSRDGVALGDAKGAEYTDTSGPDDGTYVYRVTVADAVGNVSKPSNAVVVVVDRTAPERPEVRVEETPTAGAPRLSWAAVPGAADYVVRRDGKVVAHTAVSDDDAKAAEGTTFTDEGADEGDHAYTVTAVDAAGNESKPSDDAGVTVDRQAPAAPTGVSASSPARKPVIRWDAVADAVSYLVLRDGQVVAGVAGTTSYTDEPDAGTHVYAVQARDAAGNVSAPSTEVKAEVDLTAPARPEGATGSGISSGLPWVRWTAVGDAVSYRVTRDGVTVATVTDTEYRPAAMPADGTYVYSVTARDAAGNRSAPSDAVTIVVDTVAPAAVTGLVATTPTRDEPTLTWDAAAGAETYRVLRDGTQVARVTTPGHVDPDAADGTHTYAVLAVDRAGNEAVPATVDVTVDRTAPPVPSLTAPARTNADPVLTIGAAGDATHFAVERDGADLVTIAATPAGASFTDTAVGEGSHTYRVRALDALGNASARSVAALVAVDRTAPDAVTSLVAASPVAGPVSLTWDEPAEARAFIVLRDGAEVGEAAGGLFTDPVADGTYAYRVVAVDAAGNRSHASDAVSVTVDTVAPDAPSGLAAAAALTAASPALTWDPVADATGYVVYRDGTRLATVTEPAATDGAVASGHRYAYAVAAVDAAGNESSPSDPVAVTYDAAAPAPPAGLAVRTTPTAGAPELSWDAVADASGYAVLRDDIEVGTVTDPAFRDDDAGEGEHAYAVIARDEAGNASAPSAAVTAVVDRTAPTAPTGLTAPSPTAAAIDLAFDPVADATGYRLELDGAAAGTAAAPAFTVADATEGDHVLRVRAVDAAGNVSSPSAPLTVVVDRTAPAAPELTGPAAPTNALPALQWTTVAGAVAYELRRDGTAVATGPGTHHADDPGADGTYVYGVVAIDAAGNRSQPSATVTVEYRTAPPGVPGALAADSPTRAAPGLTWAAVPDATAYVVRRDGTELARPTVAHLSDADAADGEHVYTVAAVDAAGNVSAASSPVSVVVDRVAPAAPDGNVAAAVTNGDPELTWTAADDAVAVMVARDGTEVARTADGGYRDAGRADGTFSYRLYAEDAAGNRSAASTPLTVEVDRTAPAAPGHLAAAASPTAAAPALTYDAVAGAVAYAVLRDDAEIARTAAVTYADTAAADGVHRYRVVAVDAAGNVSPASDEVSVERDRVAPDAPVASAASPTRAAPHLTWPAVTGAVRYRVARDGDILATTGDTELTDTDAADGTHAYRVVALDAAGNASPPSDPISVAVDTVAPDAPELTAPSPTRTPAATWAAVPDAAAYRLLADGDPALEGTAREADLAGLADGVHELELTAVDAAGNRSRPAVAELVVDTVAPDAPTGLRAASPTRATPHLTWDAVAGADAYAVLRDGAEIDRTTAPAYDDAGLTDDGRHAYAVAALDAAGNRSADSAPLTVVFRPGAPGAVTGLRAVASPTSVAPELRWHAVPNARSYRVLRDGAEAGRADDTTFTDDDGPADGPHRYEVAAIGASGIEGEESDPVTVEVDTTPPGTVLGAHPTGVTGAVVRFSFSSGDADATGAECRADGAAFAPCTSPVELELADGEHAIEVRAVDAAGNADPTPATFRVMVDATPPAAPTLTATPDPDLPLGSRRATVYLRVLAGADAVRVVVRRGDDVVHDGAVPGNLTDDGLADETRYRYTAIAYDAAGNVSDAATATAETPDRTAPARPPAPAGAGYPLQVTWPDESGTTFTLERDGTAIARTTRSSVRDVDAVDAAAPVAPDGLEVTEIGRTGLSVDWRGTDDRGTRYRYVVHGEDEAGNTGDDSPEAELLARSGIAGYRVLVNGEVVAEEAGTGATISGLTAGLRRTVTVVAVDAAGNASEPSDAVAIGDDETSGAPEGLAGTTPTKEHPALTWSAVDGATAYVIERDGHQAGRVTTTTFTDEAVAADGSYVYTVAAVGPAGVIGEASAPRTIVLDTVAPVTAITAGPGAAARSDVTFELGPDEEDITFTCALDGGAAAACTSPWTLQDLARGEHRVSVVATDAAGNADETPATATFTVDVAAPGAPSLTAVADETLAAGSAAGRVAVTAAPGAGAARVVVTEGSRLVLDTTGGSVTDDVPDGVELTYRAVSYDAVGNGSAAVTVTVRTPDRTAPASPRITGASGYPLLLRWTMEDGATATVRRGAATVTETTALETRDDDAVDREAPEAPDGVAATGITTDAFDVRWTAAPDRGTEYRYTATVRDRAGNVSAATPLTPATATSGTARYRILVDGAVAAETTSLRGHLTGFASGSTHHVAVVALDAAGNASGRSTEVTVVLAARTGTPPPVARILGEPLVTRPRVAVRLKADVQAGNAPVTAVTWKFADGTTASGTQVDRTFRTTGAELVQLSATDSGGGTATGSMTVLVDGKSPVAKLDGATPAGIVVVGTDDLSGVASLSARWAGGSASVKGARLVLKLPAKVTSVEVTSRDRAGNEGSVNLRLRSDRLRPSLTVTGPALSLAPKAKLKLRAPGAKLLVDGRKAGASVTVVTGRRHVIEAIDGAGNRSRVTVIVLRDAPIARLTAPALDGARHDELWPGRATETGIRRYLLRAVEQRLVLAGALPKSFKLTTAFTPAVTDALKAFQKSAKLAVTGLVDAPTKAALDRVATRATTTWSAP